MEPREHLIQSLETTAGSRPTSTPRRTIPQRPLRMRIQSCHIGAFGPFLDVPIDDLDHPVIVLHGENEAGKTSFFHFLQSMLYGIYPVDAARHPYAPHGGQPIEGSLTVKVDGESPATVSRRLRSSPQGTLRVVGSDDTTDLRNRTVPAVQHVPRSVFESVYALRLQDLVELEGTAWDEVQDRLLGSLSVDHVRSARHVIDELEDEATDLWRPDNRGKPEAKALEARRRELREQATQARERDRTVRRLHDEIAEIDARLDELKAERVQRRADRHRAERLVPVRRLLQQVEALDEEAGALDAYTSIPEDPRALLDSLDEQLADVETRLDEKRQTMRQLDHAIQAPTDADADVLDHASQIRGWSKRVEVFAKQTTDLADARQAVEEAERRLESACSVLSGPWDEDAHGDAVRSLSLSDLRERLRAFEEADRTRREAEAAAETLDLQSGARAPVELWAGVAAMGALLVLVGWIWELPIPGVPVFGAVVTFVGAWRGFEAWHTNRDREAQRAALDLDARRDEAESRARAVAELVSDLPLPASRLERPGPDLAGDLYRLQEAVRERDARASTATRKANEVDEARASVHELAAACGLSEADAQGPVPDLVADLEQRLDAAEERRENAQSARREIPELRPEIETLGERRAAARERKEDVTRRLETLGDGDLDAGIETLARRRKAARRAELTRDRLHSEFPDWKERRDEIREIEAQDGEWTYTDEQRAATEQRLEAIEKEIREAETARAEKKKDVEHLREKPSVAEIDSELAHVNRRLQEVARERDRLMLLAEIVRKADFDFRRKHQPDVIRRASRILSGITQGRYDRLALEDDGRRLVVYRSGSDFAVDVKPPLSQGTLDQIYLAIRLAIVDHLDDGRAALPLFLDEVFVNWDRTRRRGAYEVLHEMSKSRQLFFFTCHPYFAREVSRHLDAESLDLEALRAEG